MPRPLDPRLVSLRLSSALLACSLIAASGSGCLAAKRELPASEGKVVGGAELALARYPAAVAILHAGEGVKGVCSGVFISDELLLTAAHCTPDRSLLVQAEASITLARSSKASQAPIVTGLFVRHPDYRKGNPAHDLAVVRFPEGTAPAVATLAEASPAVGAAVEFVGFGRSDFGQDARGTGTKQLGTNTVARIDRDMLIRIESAVAPAEDYEVGASNLNTGDSGGPLFDLQERVLGISAWMAGPKLDDDRLKRVWGWFANVNEASNRAFIERYRRAPETVAGTAPRHGWWGAVEPNVVLPFCAASHDSSDGFAQEERQGALVWCRLPDAAGVESNLKTKRSELPARLLEP